MILGQALPLGKTFFSLLRVPAHDALFLTRILLACVLPSRNLSAALIASSMRGRPCHRGTVIRYLRHLPTHVANDWLEALFGNLLRDDLSKGTWLFLLDQTYCGHQSDHLQNAFSTAHRGRRQDHDHKNKRKKKKKQQQSFCHCFVFGLLLTPSGLRLPVFLSYYTKEYCQLFEMTYRKQTELAAALIDQLRVPAQARVVVVGDTAFDAAPILAACQRRHFAWVVSMNNDRRLNTAMPRPQVLSLAANCTAEHYVPVKLTPGQGSLAAQRRPSLWRVGPKAKSRTFWVHPERCDVFNVGTVRVFFSSNKATVAGQKVCVQKVLMTNDLERTIEEIIDIYDLRWQIELFFKEMKSIIGLADYRFKTFDEVNGWVNGCVLTFLYLEWYRAMMLEQSKDHPAERERWRRQRCHGLALAVLQDVEHEDILAILEMCQAPDGPAHLQELLRRALPKEYRKAI
jgi:hypothetical protein